MKNYDKNCLFMFNNPQKKRPCVQFSNLSGKKLKKTRTCIQDENQGLDINVTNKKKSTCND